MGTVINCISYKVFFHVQNIACNIRSMVMVHNFVYVCVCVYFKWTDLWTIYHVLSYILYIMCTYLTPLKDMVPPVNMCPLNTVLGRSSVLPRSAFDLFPNLPPAFLPAAHRSKRQAVNQCGHWWSSYMKKSFTGYSDMIITSHTILL